MAASNSERNAAYQQEVANFLSSEQTSSLHINDGMGYHRARPLTASTEPLIDNLKERLEIAQAILTRIRGPEGEPSTIIGGQDVKEFRYNLMQFALFLFVDFEHIRSIEIFDRQLLIESVRATEAFIAAFLQTKSLNPQPPPPVGPETSVHGDGPDEVSYQPNAGGNQKKVTSVKRDRKERAKAFQRDNGACVFSQLIEPQVAHIWPFAINEDKAKVKRTKMMLSRHLLLMNPVKRAQLEVLFTGSGDELGTSDKTWNMITMNGVAHDYWRRAYFALKWHSEVGTKMLRVGGEMVEHTIFRVQWHWLPLNVLNALSSQPKDKRDDQVPARHLIDLDTPDSINSIAGTISAAIDNPPIQHSTEKATLRDSDGRLIETGRLFTLQVATKDRDKMKAVIDAQFLAILMASFSGAGESVDDLNPVVPPEYFPQLSDVVLQQLEASVSDDGEE
jgi:hypothetical protein